MKIIISDTTGAPARIEEFEDFIRNTPGAIDATHRSRNEFYQKLTTGMAVSLKIRETNYHLRAYNPFDALKDAARTALVLLADAKKGLPDPVKALEARVALETVMKEIP